MDRCKTARRSSESCLEDQYRDWGVSKVEIGDTGIKREIKGKEGRREEFNYSCTTTCSGRTSSLHYIEYQTAFTSCQGSSCSESCPCSLHCPRSTGTRTPASGSTNDTPAYGQACYTAHTLPFAPDTPASHSSFNTHTSRFPTCSRTRPSWCEPIHNPRSPDTTSHNRPSDNDGSRETESDG